MKTTCIIFVLLLSSNLAYGQGLTVFYIDTANFPLMKAKYYASDKDGNQILNLSTSDFQIAENGQARMVKSVNCPTPKPVLALSSVLVMDASGSMNGKNLNLAKEAARVWIEEIPLGYSECAITAFDNKNYLFQDFTTDRNLLLQKVNTLFAAGGTNYDAALLNPAYGGLIISKNGKNKKVIVLLTDGLPQTVPQINDIIDEANIQNCIIYSVVLGMRCPQSLKDISNQTGGQWFEGITTAEDAKNVYQQILFTAQGNDPCTIEWESQTKCKPDETNVVISLIPYNLSSNVYYNLSEENLAELKFNPYSINFMNIPPGETRDTIITMTANNVNLQVTNIISTNPDFSISPTFFSLDNGKSINLTITYSPKDSSYSFGNFTFVNNSTCTFMYYVLGGFKGVKPIVKTLKLTNPNGSEVFLIGADTNITWDGIAESDTVILELSINNGNTWNLITNYASGLKYSWKDIPSPESNECLIKIKQPVINTQTDSLPKIEWQSTYGGTNVDEAKSIQGTSDGGYIVAGNTSSRDIDVSNNKGMPDIWVVKLDAVGNIMWQKTLGGTAIDYANVVRETSDGGYIVAGFTSSINGDITENRGNYDMWVVKLDYAGEIVWQKCYGGSGFESANSLDLTPDGGFILAGRTNSNIIDIPNKKGDSDFWVVKIDSIGNLEWQSAYGGGLYEMANSIKLTLDGGYIVAGYSNSKDMDLSVNNGKYDYWIVKLNILGNIEWSKTIGGSLNDLAFDVDLAIDGGYIVGGYTLSSDGDINNNNGGNDIFVIKIDDKGNIQWKNTYGGSGYETLTSLVTTKDGNYILVGGSNNSAWIVKLDIDGTIIWQQTFGGSDQDLANSINQTNDGAFIIAGMTNSKNGDITKNNGAFDYWVFKLPSEIVFFQEDISDSVFSIVEPKSVSKDIYMGKVLVSNVKDSVITDFISNTGKYNFAVDSIYFTGTDVNAFSLVSGIPPFMIDKNRGKDVEFRFIPNKADIHEATINIKTRAGILQQKIHGEGIQPKLELLTNFVDFGLVDIGTEKDINKIIAIKNVGSTEIDISEIKIIQDTNFNFKILSVQDDMKLNPGDTLFMNMRFEPQFAGYQKGIVNFKYEGFGSPLEMDLYGQGIFKGNFSLNLEVLDAEAYPRKNVKVYLRVIENNYFNYSGVSAIKAELNFNPTLLAPMDYPIEISDDKNAKIILENLPVNFKAGDTIATIWFRVGLGNAEKCNLELSNVELIGGTSELTIDNGTFTLLGICEEGGTRLINPNSKEVLMEISPNLNDGNLAIIINLIEKGLSTLSIHNSNGQLMYEQNISGTTGKIDLNIDTKEYGNGLYFVSLQTPTIRKVKQMVVFK